MGQVLPISSSRISGLLTRQRLTKQYQADQLDLFRLQEQISTGVRISLPSEDAPAALRAISFQKLLSRKEQLASNVKSGLLFLGTTDAALGGPDGVSTVLSRIKADTLGVIGTVATDEERQAAIANINGTLESLVTLGNRQFNGRYIFGGTQSDIPPYSFDQQGIVYHGDDRQIENYADIGVLFSSSISGQDVFGGVSAAVKGTVDLNPALTADTLLSSLRAGRGINSNGSLKITDGDSNNSSIIDLTSASTIGDVVKLIEDNPPEGKQVEVAISSDGLTVKLSSGTLVISEVGAGTTARELGLLNNTGSTTVVGDGLDPLMLKTTRLENLVGSKASATLNSDSFSNNIQIEALVNDASLNGVTISIVDGGDIGTNVNVVYDSGAKTLTISVDDDGFTTASQVIDAINAEGSFRAAIDYGDVGGNLDAGDGAVEIGVTAQLVGGTGKTLDLDSGIRVVNGGETYDISFGDDETVEDLLNRLNHSEAGLLAEVNEDGNGINIRSRLSGNDFQIGEIGGGSTAADFGIRTLTAESELAEFNFGVGVPRKDPLELNIESDAMKLTTSTGDEIAVDLSAATTVAAMANAINSSGDNVGKVSAFVTTDGTGIRLVDNTTGTGRLTFAQAGDPINIVDGVSLTVPRIDFVVTATDGTTLPIDIATAETVQDVLDLVNNAAGNGGRVVARLADSGNGIELVDTAGGAGQLTVTKIGTSKAAEYLGLLESEQTTKSSVTGTFTGVDRNALETESVFNSLIRLRDALDANDLPEIERAAGKLDNDLNRVLFAQADIGVRYQNLQLTQYNIEDETIQVKAALSEEIDVDLVEAISQMTARQIALEASLRVTANILSATLLDYI